MAVDVGLGEGLAGGANERAHLIGVGLGGVVGIFAAAFEWVLGGCRAEAPALAVEQGYANAEGPKVYSCDDCHALLLQYFAVMDV